MPQPRAFRCECRILQHTLLNGYFTSRDGASEPKMQVNFTWRAKSLEITGGQIATAATKVGSEKASGKQAGDYGIETKSRTSLNGQGICI